MKPIVVIESPYKAHDEWQLRLNLAYARALVEHVTLRGGAPVASHLLITQSLDDRDPELRALGIAAGLELLRVADQHAFGVDLGISTGMQLALDASPFGERVERLSLPAWAAAFQADEPHVRVTQTLVRQRDALIAQYAPKWHVHERTRA